MVFQHLQYFFSVDVILFTCLLFIPIIFFSCKEVRDTAREEQNFWIFEAVTLILGVISYGIVILRQKRLDKHFLEKINKQIASGV
jgi:hypothetical protein